LNTRTQPATAPIDRSSETRARILGAALQEFSAHGFAGARTERIAAAAGVNKALLYYHYQSKENLYVAVVETISVKIRDRSMAVFMREATPGERLLRTALDHFDRILAQGEFQRLMQQEMMRLHQGEAGALPIIVKRVFAPIQTMFQALVREGISSGELIDVDPMQIHLSALGANVLYFMGAPIWRLVLPFDPYAPEAVAERRRMVVEFLGQAMFTDRKHGAELAARVLADMPMPEMNTERLKFGGKDERA
jgi:TetR/AcrR family transcriptional regulator